MYHFSHGKESKNSIKTVKAIVSFHSPFSSIETNLYKRQGKAITNFKTSLPAIHSDLANALLKDPYNFEFITLSEQVKEKDLEQKLIQHISQFLLELGKGFAYMGRQFQLKVGNKEYRTDLLFYHTKLKSYIVIDLLCVAPHNKSYVTKSVMCC